MIKWKKLVQKIPSRVQITKDIFFDVLWTDEFADKKQMGSMDPNTKQIVIKKGMSNKDTAYTFFHELIHAISDIYEIGLTETQVEKLEKVLYYILKPNNMIRGI